MEQVAPVSMRKSVLRPWFSFTYDSLLEYSNHKVMAGHSSSRCKQSVSWFLNFLDRRFFSVKDCMTILCLTRISPFQVWLGNEQFQNNCNFCCDCGLENMDQPTLRPFLAIRQFVEFRSVVLWRLSLVWITLGMKLFRLQRFFFLIKFFPFHD